MVPTKHFVFLCIILNIFAAVISFNLIEDFEVYDNEPEIDIIENQEELNICPKEYEWAFQNGTYCCLNPVEKFNSTLEEETGKCDGNWLTRSSTCCLDDEYISCPNGNNCS